MSGITRTIIIVLSLFNHTASYSQRYDFNWVFGYSGGQGNPIFGTTLVNFNQGNPIATLIPECKLNIFEANASISDTSGKLLYYTNGYDIEDSKFEKVIGATNLGIRYWNGLVCDQGVLFLPMPSNDTLYYLLYVNKLLSSPQFYIQDLKYLIINKNSNIVFMKDTVIHDTINEGCLTACKHANGRDWWIILNEKNTNLFYKFLLTPQGIGMIDTQRVGPSIIDGVGQAVFSPNGEYFAVLDAIDFRVGLYIHIYHFDRCTGNFIFFRKENYPTSGLSGISFSSNSRYLYYSEQKNLYQFDIMDPMSFNNLELLDTIESQTLPWGSQYFMHQLGPDGRIYISNAHNNFVMHVINRPNEKGKNCLSRSNSFALKTLGGKGNTNMPYYRLGPLDGSSCDTLGIDNIPWAWWRHDQDTTDHLRFEFIDLCAYEVTEWHWDFGDGIITVEQSPIHSFQKNGIYEVCLIAKNKNGADTLCKTLNVGTVSSKAVDETIEFEIFPNPCAEYFIVNVLNYIPEKMNLTLYNLEGQEIFSKRLFEGSNGVDVESIPNGVYLVKVLEKGEVVMNEKVIKM